MPKPKISVEVEHAGTKYKWEGETIEDAFNNHPEKLSYKTIKMKALMRVTKGGKTCEQLFTPRAFRRFLVNDYSKKIWAEHLSLRLK